MHRGPSLVKAMRRVVVTKHSLSSKSTFAAVSSKMLEALTCMVACLRLPCSAFPGLSRVPETRRAVLTQEAKEIVCSSERLLGFLLEACTCSIESIRITSISVVMQCSSNDSARVNLLNAYIPERALKTVM